MLVELAKRDSEWRKIALKICGDKTLSDDLVQEMYLRLQDKDKSKATTEYVATSLWNLHRNYKTAKRQRVTTRLTEWQTTSLTSQPPNELNDEQQKIIDAFNELPWFQRELILESMDKSRRKIADEINMNHNYVHKKVTEGKAYVINKTNGAKYN